MIPLSHQESSGSLSCFFSPTQFTRQKEIKYSVRQENGWPANKSDTNHGLRLTFPPKKTDNLKERTPSIGEHLSFRQQTGQLCACNTQTKHAALGRKANLKRACHTQWDGLYGSLLVFDIKTREGSMELLSPPWSMWIPS